MRAHACQKDSCDFTPPLFCTSYLFNQSKMASNEVQRVSKMSKEDLCDYLNAKGLDLEAIDTNRLSGATCLELSKEHLNSSLS